jgi:hypothetical protein
MHASVGIVSIERCPHFGQVSSLVVIIEAVPLVAISA